MKDKELTWEKEGARIIQIVPECECGTIAKLKGSSGFHDEWSYFYQCPNCKNLEITAGVWSHNGEQEFDKYGWVLLTPPTKQ